MEFKEQFILLKNFLGLGDFQIRYYGIIIVAAMLVAAFVAVRLAKRSRLDPDHVWGGLTWAIIPGIILARLWFVIFPPVALTAGCGDELAQTVCKDTAWFFQNFFNFQEGAVAIWSGGLSIFGAVLGGFTGAWLYFSPYHNRIVRFLSRIFGFWRFYLLLIGGAALVAWVINRQTGLLILAIVAVAFTAASITRGGRRILQALSEGETKPFPEEGLPIAPWLDIVGVTLPLAQAIGRWANYINQELYGAPTTLPWGLRIDSAHRVSPYTSTVDYPPDTLFHPLFLYEALWSLLAFVVLLNIYQRYRSRLRAGDIFLVYVAQYSLIRFLLEFLRVEVAYIPGTTINSSQVATGLAFLAAVVIFLYRHRAGAVQRQRAAEAAPAEPAADQPASDSPQA